ncbi:hypothetical protein SSX86_016885 [Deinandra increscens subsp. villosa]|uniref:Receptor-like serine/threonine-protein kinase n=1 Tax=Deinandra increscens subsp. villosa TaxID=3103831 RepID=A0AAP0GXZ3_9ASTR
MKNLTLIFLYSTLLISILITCAATDTISVNQTLKDGNTIVSAGETFELGFFSPGTSRNRYVGIWYKKISTCTPVWVANTKTPFANKSGELRVTQTGLQLLNGNKTVIWSSNSSGSGGLVARLLDTGNLVVLDQGSLVWQSFDHPGDTLVPGMRIGVDLMTGKDTHLTSWRTDNDPSPGPYVLRVVRNGYPQLFVTQELDLEYRFGPWDGVAFNGMPNLGENSTQFVFDEKEIYYEYKLVNSYARMRLNSDGTIEHMNWINRTQSWNILSAAAIDNCARYSICGPYGVCNINNAPACRCLEGFEPQRPDEWSIADSLSGCRRIKPLSCENENRNGDTFSYIAGVKFPDTNHSWYNQSMTLSECEAACKRNCSCTAYANSDIRNGGSGCLLWFDDLMDIRVDDEARALYIRMPASELTGSTAREHGSNSKKRTVIIVVSASLCSILVFLILAVYFARRKKKRSKTTILGPVPTRDEKFTNESGKEDAEMSSYSFSVIAKATSNFSVNNKLGEGGFGPVYKGVLENGQEIAVKRLSESSTQGIDEFKNEVKFIARLQHRNLVKLLGSCIQGNERMLIYEYMANKSLDSFIFDACTSSMLDWPRLFHIIHGIARYEPEDIRLSALQEGLADTSRKLIQTECGYIPPEYALHGIFSVKTDVYSFGVLVLEIVSGKKNRGFSQEEHNHTLTGHAWGLHKEGKSLELLSSSLRASCVESQVLRSIHIGLLCVQHHADDRPTMSSVVLMLGNENALPPPKQPAFFAEDEMPELRSISSAPTLDSVDTNTITLLIPR